MNTLVRSLLFSFTTLGCLPPMSPLGGIYRDGCEEARRKVEAVPGVAFAEIEPRPSEALPALIRREECELTVAFDRQPECSYRLTMNQQTVEWIRLAPGRFNPLFCPDRPFRAAR